MLARFAACVALAGCVPVHLQPVAGCHQALQVACTTNHLSGINAWLNALAITHPPSSCPDAHPPAPAPPSRELVEARDSGLAGMLGSGDPAQLAQACDEVAESYQAELQLSDEAVAAVRRLASPARKAARLAGAVHRWGPWGGVGLGDWELGARMNNSGWWLPASWLARW